MPADESVDRTVAIVDRAGAVTSILETPGNWVEPRVSPDGRRVLIRRMADNCDLWIYDLDRNVFSRLTHEGDNHNPVWAPDGRRVAVSRRGEEFRSLVILAADGSTGPVHIGRDDLELQPFSWSRDGRTLVCTSTSPGTRTDIWTIPASGEGAAAVFLQTKFRETDPDLSPDQSWMAYASDESGRYEIYLKVFPGPGPRIQVSTDGGRFPAWSRSGRELFFVADTKMMVIDVESGEEPRIGTPRVLFQRMEEAPSRRYDILPDGKRFVMARSLTEESDLKQIRVIQNWTADMGQIGAGAAGH